MCENVLPKTYKNWTNQYIGLVHSKPNLIVTFPDRNQLEAQRLLIHDRMQKYQQTIIELGSGSGEHLVELARRNPQALCLGFELRFKRVFKTAEKAEKQSCENVLVLQFDASRIGELFEASSLDHIYINFPDPWAKRAWLKHRLLNQELLLTMSRLLKVGALLHYKTDHKEYFERTLTYVAHTQSLCLQQSTIDLYQSPHLKDNIQTEFERIFVFQRLPICWATISKVQTSFAQNV